MSSNPLIVSTKEKKTSQLSGGDNFGCKSPTCKVQCTVIRSSNNNTEPKPCLLFESEHVIRRGNEPKVFVLFGSKVSLPSVEDCLQITDHYNYL